MNQTDKKNVPFIVFAIVFRISIIQIHTAEFKDRCTIVHIQEQTLYVHGVIEIKDLNKSCNFLQKYIFIL